MQAPDRCGAKGIVVRRPEGIGVEVTSLVSEVTIGHRTVSLPEDLSVGMFIPMEVLFGEHRGLVIVDENEDFVDEGEIWPIERASAALEFVSDYDDGPFANAPVEKLVGQKVEIKFDLIDRLGAYRRLREFKKLFGE